MMLFGGAVAQSAKRAIFSQDAMGSIPGCGCPFTTRQAGDGLMRPDESELGRSRAHPSMSVAACKKTRSDVSLGTRPINGLVADDGR